MDGSSFSTAHTEFPRGDSYGDYLMLEQLLTAQRSLTDAHDEPLFIVVHHVAKTGDSRTAKCDAAH